MDSSIMIQTTINAPVPTVWVKYTGSEHIVQWNSASDTWHTPQAENDLTVGGKFSFRMEAKDKSAGFDFEGTYTSVQEHELIEYVMADGRKVHVEFKSVPTGTQVTVTFEVESDNSVEMQRDGWQAILDSFKRYVESQIVRK